MQKLISSQAKTSRHQHAVMLAKILMFAIDDFQELGMEEWGRLLNEGISEIMKKYDIDETDLRVRNHKAVN